MRFNAGFRKGEAGEEASGIEGSRIIADEMGAEKIEADWMKQEEQAE